MGDLSFKSIRSFSVTTGNAPNYHSMGLAGFDPEARSLPMRSNVSDSGVAGVARESIDTLAAGADPDYRIVAENILRPNYAVYLNAGAIKMAGVGNNDLPEPDYANQARVNYDTDLGYQYVRNQVTNPPAFQASKFRTLSGQPLSPAEKDEVIVRGMMMSGNSQYIFDGSAQ